MHVKALKGRKLSLEPLTEAIWSDYGRSTVFSEGPVWAPWKLLNWEMTESGRRREQCLISGGEGSLAHQERSHKASSESGGDTNLHAQRYAHSRWTQSRNPTKADQNIFAGYQSVSAGLIHRRESRLGLFSDLSPLQKNIIRSHMWQLPTPHVTFPH